MPRRVGERRRESVQGKFVIDYESLFNTIVSDPRYLNNLDWGHAREGHPEGSIRAHIIELEQNLEILQPKFSDEDVWKLRILIHTHDTFKAQAEVGVAIEHPRSHASLARAFLAGFCADADLLAMTQHHDVPFAMFRQVQTKGSCNRARFDALLAAIGDWSLFQAFLIIDGCTEGKGGASLAWFFGEIRGRVESQITEADIIARAERDRLRCATGATHHFASGWMSY